MKDISSHSKDRCFIFKSGDFAFIREKNDYEFACDVAKAQCSDSLFDKPCPSEMYLNSVYIKETDLVVKSQMKLIEKKKFYEKDVFATWKWVCTIPLRHESETIQH